MQKRHKRLLVALLMLFGLSLLIPGVIAMFQPEPAGLNTQLVDQANQFRALHGMMAGLGVMACLACYRIERERTLVIGIALLWYWWWLRVSTPWSVKVCRIGRHSSILRLSRFWL
ncbi:MAG: DUF4345 family protein [Candidatus Thiodiazotropha taylori]|nr:DUF4345 family protein [Candidatus Thiodiazotropha taylori]